MNRIPGWVVLACAVGGGAVSMALEIVAGRVMTPFVGGTLSTWGALISAFLIGMSVGYDAGGRVADRHPHPGVMAILFLGSAVWIAMMPLYASALMEALAQAIGDLRYAALAGALILTGPPAAALAATGPFCFKLALTRTESSGRLSGRLSACGAAGSITGTLGSSFYLIPNMGLTSILWTLAGICLALCALVLIASKAPGKGALATSLAA